MSPRTAYGIAVGLLAAVNIGGGWLPGWSYVPVNLAAGAALVVVARRGGATADDLAVRRDGLGPGVALGALLAGIILVGILLGALLPATRGWFEDDRAAGIGVPGLLYQVLLRIPVGTALFEEVAFRGVLVGLGRRIWSRHRGTTAAATLFGLWHIAPSLTFAGANPTAGDLPAPLVVAVAVAATALAGWVLTHLRDRRRSLAVPVVVHAAANMAAFTAAWVILS